MHPDFHMLITKSARELADGMDEQILAFFGSEEQVRAYGHLFVIEQLPTKFVTLQSPEAMSISYYAETEIRIRPKTMAELEAEQNEQ
jgi:hypothetical protein